MADWSGYEGGSTIGTPGSEEGTIVRDNEYADGTRSARITLERDLPRAARSPYAITCGIQGWFVHTRFFGEYWDAEAAYEDMKSALVELLAHIDEVVSNDPDAIPDGFEAFVERFP